MGRSLGFASTPSDYGALFRLAFASAPYLKYLTLPEKVTRRFIMQKARRHNLKAAPTACRQTGSGSISLLCSRFFSPFPHGTGSLSVSREYLALRDGPRCFTQDFSCPALLRMPLGFNRQSCTGLSPSTVAFSKAFHLTLSCHVVVLQPPCRLDGTGLGSSVFARHYLRNHCLFSPPMGT